MEQQIGDVGVTHALICRAPECKYGNKAEKTNICKTQGKYKVVAHTEYEIVKKY